MENERASAAQDLPPGLVWCRGVLVPLGPHLNRKQHNWLAEGWYEAREITAVLRTVHKGDVVLECGAGIGVVSAIAAQVCGAAHVVSYEPNPGLIPHIRKLHELNGLTDRFTVENAVLMAGPDLPLTTRFNVHANFIGSRLGEVASRGKLIDAPVHDFARVTAGRQPDVILMDIEGAELDFLVHADLGGVRAIIIEFHPKVYGMAGVRRCKALLRAQGFDRGPGSSPSVWAAVRTGPTGSEETQLPQRVDH